MITEQLKQILDASMHNQGFLSYGFSALSRPLTIDFYKDWLNDNLHGDMKYLEEHFNFKETPQERWPQARSAIVFAMPYLPHPQKRDLPIQSLKISRYAQGYDYHFWLKEKLQTLSSQLKELFPQEEFLCFTDSSPVLERDLAQRAGLGWFGKNTCLIQRPYGSFFLIGEIYTSLDLEAQNAPSADFCGTCTRCLDACPTGALISPHKLDARKCISYLTIESRQNPPLELREKIAPWFFGCDICQDVCPWNKKTLLKFAQEQQNSREQILSDLRYLLSASGKKLTKDFLGTPLARAGAYGLKRNALLMAAHYQAQELESEIADLKNHPKLGELAEWCLNKIFSGI